MVKILNAGANVDDWSQKFQLERTSWEVCKQDAIELHGYTANLVDCGVFPKKNKNNDQGLIPEPQGLMVEIGTQPTANYDNELEEHECEVCAKSLSVEEDCFTSEERQQYSGKFLITHEDHTVERRTVFADSASPVIDFCVVCNIGISEIYEIEVEEVEEETKEEIEE